MNNLKAARHKIVEPVRKLLWLSPTGVTSNGGLTGSDALDAVENQYEHGRPVALRSRDNSVNTT